MQKIKGSFIVVVILAILFFSGFFTAQAAEKTTPSLKYLPSYEVSESFTKALSNDDLDAAASALLELKPNPKTLFLMRETTRLIKFINSKKPSGVDAKKKYLNTAIGFHNLYLYLKKQNIESAYLFKNAVKNYGRACGVGTKIHRDGCNLLRAALFAASGNERKAEKLFKRIDEKLLAGKFEALEYLAAYYAAMGNVDRVVEAVQKAYAVNPDRMVTWLMISDDFYRVQNDPSFRLFVETLFRINRDTVITLSVPKSKKPVLRVEDPTGIFDTSDMPKYKKRRK
jgi:tetratricopeptide (TPR) repeat protein